MSATKRVVAVRVLVSEIAELDQAARRLGMTRSRLTALCMKSFVDYFEATGREGLPEDWERKPALLDGRTKEARKKAKRGRNA